MPYQPVVFGIWPTISKILMLIKNQSRTRKIQILSMVFLQILLAQFELLSIGALVPVMALTIGTEDSNKNEYIELIQKYLELNDNDLIALFLGMFFFLICVVNLLKTFNIWLQNTLAAKVGADISGDFYNSSLGHDYLFSVESGSSQLMSRVTYDMNVCISSTLALFSLSLSIFSILFILTGILIYDFHLTVVISFLTIGFYLLVERLLRERIIHLGEVRSNHTSELIKVMRESYSNIFDVILTGSREHFTSIFRYNDSPVRAANAQSNVLKLAPRFVLESIIGVIVFFVVFISWLRNIDVVSLIPTLAIIGFAGMRLIPAAQQTYGSISSLRATNIPLQRVYGVIDRKPDPLHQDGFLEPIEMAKKVSLNNIWYKYEDNINFFNPQNSFEFDDKPETSNWVLKGLSIDAPKNKITAITGKSGSGKTTVANIFSTLLFPQKGEILLDGAPMDLKTLRRWRRSIAYVPQIVRLSDSTISENIAFGVSKEKVNMKKVKVAAKAAQLHDFIDCLPKKYDETIGEDGTSLSGGQRQRLAIARAIYRGAKMIVLDEATSSLDNETEVEVMEGIKAISAKITILIVAHRLSTIRNADMIYHIEKGEVSSSGTFDELFKKSRKFQALVNAANFSIHD